MSRAVLLAGLLATLSAAQADHAAPGFQYVGCVRADPAAFPASPGLAHPFSAPKCQEACGPRAAYAALGNGCCHCDDPTSGKAAKWDVVDEALCSTPCHERDEQGGHCGGPAVDGKAVFNLYMKFPTDPTWPLRDDKGGKGMEPTRPPVEVRPVATVIETMVSCPPEVPDCPANKKPACPPEGCHPPPPPTSAPWPHPKHANCTHMQPPPPVYTKLPISCDKKPPHCPPEGCPPKAPPPECNGDCPGKPTAAPTKMPIHTPASSATNTPVIVSEASARQSGRIVMLLGLGALAMAVGLS